MARSINTKRLEQLIKVWPNATSLEDACIQAGIKIKDPRNRARLRRTAESTFNVILPPHNSEFSTDLDDDINCPSTLVLKDARKHKGFICSSYVNNTELSTVFMDALEHFAKDKGFQILIKPVRYRNPNAISRNEDYHWDERIIPYALTKDFSINVNIVFSNVSLQATTANPLAGKQIAYRNKSVIYGNPALELDSVATPKDELPKLLFSTGCVNKPKYSNSDAGSKSMARHSMSAIVILRVGNKYRDYIIEFDGIGFSFFDEYYTASGKTDRPSEVAALHLGDVHADTLTEPLIRSRERLITKVNPDTIIYNDLHNHHSQSHHTPLIGQIKIAKAGLHLVKDEVQKSIDFVNRVGNGRQNIIVNSNHSEHLDQWLNRFQPNRDPHNAEYYFWLMGRIATTNGKSPLELAMEDGLEVDVVFLDGDAAHLIAGVDVGQHGHRGANGARTALGFHKLSRKLQTGHTHSRRIKHLHWTSGVMQTSMDYAKGYGTWSNCDTLIFNTGARTHVTYIKNKFWK